MRIVTTSLLIATTILLQACSSAPVLVNDGKLMVQKNAQTGLNWHEASQYCQQLGLQLPDKGDLVDRHPVAWHLPKGNYWTRTMQQGNPCIVATSYGISNCGVPPTNRLMFTRCVKP